ncbi:MAG: TIGR02281 family clan AA aspartic protease [Pseudolabrys sp.]
MRNLLMIAAVLAVTGGYGARLLDSSVPHAKSVSSRATEKPRQTQNGPREMVLSSDRQGHFQVNAEVDGRRIGFVVDTGASQVILRESDAARIGIRPMRNDYSAIVSTANGKIKAAPARLNRVEVGDITVRDVSALVLPDEVLSQNLLGVSFLSRLKRYEYAQGRLLLEQ